MENDALNLKRANAARRYVSLSCRAASGAHATGVSHRDARIT
ncbi:hypothetical protein BLL52_2335 [Rhodoferax antarcticus ANT.BR]|uniref:Uncharacterized protein n=1 Tax=Rhodoferax antarcticus ANT.BR TaxID=1111071 RepID=A0A1Q8YDP6_9BURK|nr:hypothetical protein BLL52_2335 [Rhodoferax antarcticus ANT.BR]